MPRGNPQPWFRPSRNTWYVTIDGVQHNLRTADKQEAVDKWHDLMAGEDEPAATTKEMLVIDLLALFAEHCERRKKPTTYQWYRQFLESFVRSIPRSLGVQAVKPFHVSRWLDGQSNWGESTRRGAVTALKAAFQWAEDEGYIDRSPIRRVRKPRAGRRETVLTEEQRTLLLDEASDQEFRDLLTLLMETGARPQEVRTVEARHVDLKNGLWVFPPDESKMGEKTQKPRIIYLTPTALELTLRLVERYPEGPLLRNSQGKPWTRNAIRCRFRRLRNRKNGGFPKNLCAYVLRHSFATDALEKGIDPITLATLLGHQDPTMLSRVYQHVDQRAKHLKVAAEKATRRENVSGQDE